MSDSLPPHALTTSYLVVPAGDQDSIFALALRLRIGADFPHGGGDNLFPDLLTLIPVCVCVCVCVLQSSVSR